MSFGSVGAGGTLEAKRIRPHRVRGFRVPHLGRVMFSRDPGFGSVLAREVMHTHLHALHLDGDGAVKGEHNLGSGAIQDNFVVALIADQLGTTANKGAPILANSGKAMYSGTGTTVNSYDYQLATAAGPGSGAPAVTLGVSADNATIQYVGTIAYTSSLAITEWGLFGAAQQGAQYSASSFSSITGTVITPTANPAWAVNQWAGYVVVDTSAATKVAGYIISNTATALTIATIGTSTGWYDLTSGGGTGSTPATTDTLGIYPLMSDHKTFGAINVVNGDSIQFTYTQTWQSGG